MFARPLWPTYLCASVHATPLLERELTRHLIRTRGRATRLARIPDAVTDSNHRPDRLELLTLGLFEVYTDGSLVEGAAWTYRKPRELLVYLACHPPGRSRGQVGVAFWPEASAADVKNNFHVALHRLRKVIGTGAIVRDGDRYRVHPGIQLRLDAVHFEEEVRAALSERKRGGDPDAVQKRLTGALASYRGDFLESETMGDWHYERRDELQRLFLDGQSASARLHLDAGGAEEAEDAYRRMVSIDSLHEGAYRGLMACRATLGDRTGALRLYERLEKLLLEELDTEPEPETAALAHRLRHNAPD